MEPGTPGGGEEAKEDVVKEVVETCQDLGEEDLTPQSSKDAAGYIVEWDDDCETIVEVVATCHNVSEELAVQSEKAKEMVDKQVVETCEDVGEDLTPQNSNDGQEYGVKWDGVCQKGEEASEKCQDLEQGLAPQSSKDNQGHAVDPDGDCEKAKEMVNKCQSIGEGLSPQSSSDGKEIIVDWDGEYDPENPLNWSSPKKILNLTLLTLLKFTTPLASSLFVPGVPGVLEDFHSSNEVLAFFVVSIYLFGYALGPLVTAPISEVFGRYWVYQVTNIWFVGFTIGCALAPTLGSLIGFRFLTGCAGSASLVLGNGSIADLYPREARGSKMILSVIGPMLGPVLASLAGAHFAKEHGWRWIFWLITITGSVLSVACFLFLSETYAPFLLERKAARLRKATGNPAYRSALATGDSMRLTLFKAFIRPLKMFFRSPAVFCFVVYMAVMYGYLFLLFTTITEMYERKYKFSKKRASYMFLGVGVGMCLGILVFVLTSDRILRKAQRKLGEGEIVPPEIRLEGLLVPALCMPVGMFWFGWCADKQVHWIVPIFGACLVGFGLVGIYAAAQSYLVDCYPRYAASVTATFTVSRSLVRAFLPLAGQPLYDGLGLGWGNSVLASIALAMVPLSFLFLRYGAWLRTTPRLQVEF